MTKKTENQHETKTKISKPTPENNSIIIHSKSDAKSLWNYQSNELKIHIFTESYKSEGIFIHYLDRTIK